MTTTDYNNTASVVVEGGVSATALAFFSASIMKMIPFLIAAIPLIILDLRYGVRAAGVRGEKVRLSTALRRTLGKCFSYVCWVVLASTMTLAFNMEWIQWLVLGLVFFNELLSIIGNYLETKGVEFSVHNAFGLIFRKGAEKAGVELSKEELDEIIKPKQPRDASGRFIKNENSNNL